MNPKIKIQQETKRPKVNPKMHQSLIEGATIYNN